MMRASCLDLLVVEVPLQNRKQNPHLTICSRDHTLQGSSDSQPRPVNQREREIEVSDNQRHRPSEWVDTELDM